MWPGASLCDVPLNNSQRSAKATVIILSLCFAHTRQKASKTFQKLPDTFQNLPKPSNKNFRSLPKASKTWDRGRGGRPKVAFAYKRKLFWTNDPSLKMMFGYALKKSFCNYGVRVRSLKTIILISILFLWRGLKQKLKNRCIFNVEADYRFQRPNLQDPPGHQNIEGSPIVVFVF